jgi:hypothetical protein
MQHKKQLEEEQKANKQLAKQIYYREDHNNALVTVKQKLENKSEEISGENRNLVDQNTSLLGQKRTLAEANEELQHESELMWKKYLTAKRTLQE